MSWKYSILLTIAIAVSPVAAPTAWAVGGEKSKSTTAGKGDSWLKAKRAIAAREYEKAIPHLFKTVEANPRNADAFNYLGYSHARAGKTKMALAFYQNALKIDPAHKGANEYLGELHLMLGDVAAAEERLAALDKACSFGCVEFDLLKDALKEYKANGKYVTSKGF